MRVEHYYKKTYIAMEHHALEHIEVLLKSYKPELIIEFGTYHGGFTKYLCDWFNKISSPNSSTKPPTIPNY